MLEWMFVGTLGGLGAVVLMGLEALSCLLTCQGKRRTRLLYAAAGLGIVLLLWWGWDALLRLIGLSWRRWVQTAFGVAALVLGMAGAFLTVHCGAERRTGRLWHEAAVGIALLMLLTCSVTIGPFLLAFSYAPERVLEVSGRASMGNMVNRAVVTGRNGRVLAAAQNTGDITACGRFQRVMGKSGDPQAQAKAALRRRSLSARVTVLGDLSLRCGGRVEAHRPQWGLEGVYDITAHEHRWEKGVFTTSLSLEGVEA